MLFSHRSYFSFCVDPSALLSPYLTRHPGCIPPVQGGIPPAPAIATEGLDSGHIPAARGSREDTTPLPFPAAPHLSRLIVSQYIAHLAEGEIFGVARTIRGGFFRRFGGPIGGGGDRRGDDLRMRTLCLCEVHDFFSSDNNDRKSRTRMASVWLDSLDFESD